MAAFRARSAILLGSLGRSSQLTTDWGPLTAKPVFLRPLRHERHLPPARPCRLACDRHEPPAKLFVTDHPLYTTHCLLTWVISEYEATLLC
jgi:hypothetical protein